MLNIRDINIHYDHVILENSSLLIPDDSLTLITGLSGSGKSTLLYRIGCISNQKNYQYQIQAKEIQQEDEKEKSRIRRHHFGYVLQDASLYEQYDVIGNLKLYAAFAGIQYNEQEYLHILTLVNLKVPLHQKINTLSGGEQQRLAIACALCKNPEVLILDEPTSNLDSNNEKIIFEVLSSLAHNEQKCIVIASHSAIARDYADKIYSIQNNQLICIRQNQENTISHKWEKKNKKIPFSFYFYYIHYFLKKFKWLNIAIMSALVLCITAIVISIGVIDLYSQQSYQAVEKISDRQLLLTEDQNKIYLNEDLSTFTQDVSQKLDRKDDVLIHPYRKILVQLQGEWIPIVPYYDHSDFDDKQMRKLDFSDEKGIYISYQLYVNMKDTSFIDQKIQVEGVIFDTDNEIDHGYQFKKSLLIKGVLDKPIKCAFLNQQDKFIYMYGEDIERLYQKYHQYNDVRGYIIEANHLDDLINLRNQAKQLGFGVNEGQLDLDALNTLGQTTKNLRIIVLIVSISVFILMLSAMQINYFYKRKREFALLFINGLSNAELHKLSLLEIAMKLLIALALSSMIVEIIDMFTKIIGMTLPLGFTSFLCFYVILFIIMTSITLAYSIIFFHKNKPENILRN